MPTLDIFNDDAFSVQSLTRNINEAPFQPMAIQQMGLFSEEGIRTTTLSIEKKGTTLTLIPAAERGSSGRVEKNDKATLVPISTVHLPQRAAVLADEVQNVRAFGTEGELETVQNIVNKKLEKLRRNIDVTLEYQRIGAIKGQVLDADGSTVILDLFTAFGVSQTTHAMVLGTSTTSVKQKITEATRKVETQLGGIMHRGMVALCGTAFFDKLVGHDKVAAAYDRYLDGQFFRESQRNQEGTGPGFPFVGVNWREYKGSVGGVPFVADDEAWLVPLGVADLFISNFAPADYMETVNTIGLPYYAKQELMRMGKGVEIESQSNPISICTRPQVVCKLTTN